MPDCCNNASAKSGVLDLCWEELIAIKDSVLPVKGVSKEAKCEDLEKIIVGDDL